jgi:hypothetical protein
MPRLESVVRKAFHEVASQGRWDEVINPRVLSDN